VVAIHAMKDGMVVSAGRDGRLVFSRARQGTLQEVAGLEFGGGSIEEFAMDPNDSLILLRCQGEHSSRWIRVDRLRQYFEELQIDWE
jgi:hypothetical protein